MAHILMAGVGAHGHVYPHLPVIAELIERGHRVTYAIPNSFAEIVASTGAAPLVHTSVLPDQSRGQQWPTDVVEGVSLFLNEAIQALPQITAALDRDRPSAVLYDIGGYCGHVLARRWQLPLVQLSPAMVAWDGMERDLGEALAFRRTRQYARYEAQFAAWLTAQGIDCDVDTFAGRPPRCAVLIPRAMQPHVDRVDESVYTFVGPSLDRRAHQGQWPSSDRPLVLVSLGSAYTNRPAFFRDCITAFAPLGYQVVLAIGSRIDPTDLGELPPNVEAHRWVPQLAVLQRARAFVTHAGMGGCCEGLYAGVPMIAVPQAVDQFGNAALLEQLGVAVHLPLDAATPKALRHALLCLVESVEVADRLAALRKEVRAAGGAIVAADMIEAQL